MLHGLVLEDSQTGFMPSSKTGLQSAWKMISGTLAQACFAQELGVPDITLNKHPYTHLTIEQDMHMYIVVLKHTIITTVSVTAHTQMPTKSMKLQRLGKAVMAVFAGMTRPRSIYLQPASGKMCTDAHSGLLFRTKRRQPLHV